MQLGTGHLLDLVGGIAGLDIGPERPTLDGLGQDGSGGAGVLDGGTVGGVELPVVVAAPGQALQFGVTQVLDQGPQPGVGTEEVFTDVGPGLGGVLLELPVDGLVHLGQQDAVHIPGQELVPGAPPDHLDHVPPGASQCGLELLDHLAVATDRAVETLQVAVDDHGQVVEMLPTGHAEERHRLGFVELAVADEGPHPAV